MGASTNLVNLSTNMMPCGREDNEERDLIQPTHHGHLLLDVRSAKETRVPFGHHVLDEPVIWKPLLQHPIKYCICRRRTLQHRGIKAHRGGWCLGTVILTCRRRLLQLRGSKGAVVSSQLPHVKVVGLWRNVWCVVVVVLLQLRRLGFVCHFQSWESRRGIDTTKTCDHHACSN